MNAEDITFIKHVIRDLPPVELDGTAPPLWPTPVGGRLPSSYSAEEDLETILQTGAERVYHQVPAEVWAEKTAITGRQYTDRFSTALLHLHLGQRSTAFGSGKSVISVAAGVSTRRVAASCIKLLTQRA